MAWAKDNGRDQRFRFVSAGGGFYHIVSQNGGYVDVAGSRNANGTNILIWTRKTSNNSNQKFRFRHIGNGRWKIYTAWGRIICLAGRKHNNGSNIHTWADHKGASTEWYFESVSNGRIYIPEPAVSGIEGKLEAYNYDSSGRRVKVNPGQSDIGVWVFNPSAPKDKYIKKKTVRTDPLFFMENKTFEYSSGTMVGSSKGNARVKSINGSDVTIEVDTVSTGEGPRGMETKQHSFEMVITHKGKGAYTSGEDYVYDGKIDDTGKALNMYGEQSGFTLKASDPEIDPSFMTFFTPFKEKWQKGDKGSTSGDIVFPLTLETSFEGSSSEKKLTAASFFNEVTIDEPIMYPLRYEVDGENVILVHYGYEAQFFTLYFNRTRGQWKLVRVKKSQD